MIGLIAALIASQTPRAGSAKAPMIFIDRRERILIVKGSFDSVARVESSTKRCGFYDVGFAVPNGFNHETNLTLLRQEFTQDRNVCLRSLKLAFRPKDMEWIW